MVKSWKEKEKQLTEWLTGCGYWQAVRQSRAWRGEAVEDIQWGPLSIELKTRRSFPPRYVTEWLEQAATNCCGRTPIVIVHGDYVRMGEQLVMMTLRDLVQLIDDVREGIYDED